MGIRKRALSLFVTFAMCFSIFPSSVWAVEAENRQEESAPISVDVVEALPLTEGEVTSTEVPAEDVPALPEDNASAEVADEFPAEEGAIPAGDDEVFLDGAALPDEPSPGDAGVLPQEDAAVEENAPDDVTVEELSPDDAVISQDAALEELSPDDAPPAQGSAASEEIFLDDAIIPQEESAAKEDFPPAEPEKAGEEEALPEKGGPEEAEVSIDKSLDAEAEGDYAADAEKETGLFSEEQRELMESGVSGQVLWTDSTSLDAGWSVAYTYTPEVTTEYTFESTNVTGDAVGWLTLANSTDQITANDDGGRANGNYRNFSFTYTLTAGTTYELHAGWYSSSTSGTMTCQLSRSSDTQSITADGTVYSADITAGGQMQYFTFTPPSSGTYVFESVNESGDPYGYLYNSSRTTLASNDDGGSGSNFSISYVLTAGTTYYYGVRFWSSSATGTISVRLTGGGSTVKTITPPTSSNPVTEDYEEITTLGERKYFKFIPQVTGRYIFESTNTSNDPVGELYEADKTTQMASNDDGAGNRNFRLVYDRDLVAGTTYYYAVRFFGSSTLGRIDVRLTLDGGGVVPIVLNAAEVALKGFLTSSVNPANASSSAVSDGNGYFSFTPEETGTYVFESTNSSGDPTAALYDRVGGTTLSTSDDAGDTTLGGNTRNFRISRELTANTTYIYTVRWLGGNSSDLNVRIRRAWNELATTMTPGFSGRATIDRLGKVAYFAFTPSEAGEYSFESSDINPLDSSIFDPLVTLYDANFTSIDSNDDGGDDRNFKLIRTLTPGTTYYYGVKRWGDSSVGYATVRLSGGGPTPTVIDAAAVERGSWTGTVTISSPGDYSYFTFTPQSAGTYIFESTNSSGDTHGHFYENGLGTPSTDSNDDGGNGLNFRLSRTLEAGRTYGYAARWHLSSSTGDISVRMTRDSSDVIPLDAAAVEQSGSTTSTATIATAGRRAYFSFTPRTSGAYAFESTNTSGDTYGYFYETSQVPTDNTRETASNDDGGSGLNFRIERSLTAGTTYYYGAKFYSGSTTGAINVRLSRGAVEVPPAGVSVRLNPTSIYVGNTSTATAQITPDNATNKSVTWRSSDESVATVVGGIVTGRAAGTATITTRTYNGIEASATITVVQTGGGENVPFYPNFEYPFLNTYSSFGYTQGYKIPQVRFEQVGYTAQQAASIYNASSRESRNAYWGGSCFGFASSALLFYKGVMQEENYNSGAHVPHDFRAPNGSTANDVKLRSMIELMQLSQPFWNEVYTAPRQPFNPQRIAAELDNGNPVVFHIGLRYRGGDGGHAIVIYDYTRNGDNYTFNIYDNSRFVNSITCRSSGNYARGSRDYSFNITSAGVTDVWPVGYYTASSIQTIYDTLKSANHSGAANLLEVNEQRYIYIFCPVGDVTLWNSAGNVARIRGSELSGDDLNLDLILPTFSIDDNPESGGTRYYTIVAPEDSYRITAAGTGTVTIVGVDMSVDVSANVRTAPNPDEPLMTISSDLCTIGLDTEDEDSYSVNYYVYNDRFDTLSVEGTAGEWVSVSLKAGESRVDVEGARNITATAVVDGKPSVVQDSYDLGQITVPFSVSWGGANDGAVGGMADAQDSLRIAHDQNNSDNMNFAALAPDPNDDLDKYGPMGAVAEADNAKRTSTLNTREQLAAPTFDFRRNSNGTWEVNIVAPDNVTVLYYTTDESDPGTTNPKEHEQKQTYGGIPIPVTPDTQIVAVATKHPSRDSEVVKWKFSDAQLTSGPTGNNYTLGDVDNSDGIIDSSDASLALQIWAHLIDYTPEQYSAADVDRTGVVDSSDASLILQKWARLISEFPDNSHPNT